MKTPNLIAIAAATLITIASLGAVTHHVDSRTAPASQINGHKVINLAPVNVHPTADQLRSAALMAGDGTNYVAMVSETGHSGDSGDVARFSLLGSQLAMPYYSFGNKFGRISKE
jgi:hypothetical protein